MGHKLIIVEAGLNWVHYAIISIFEFFHINTFVILTAVWSSIIFHNLHFNSKAVKKKTHLKNYFKL